jgi:hypothetical protein
MAGRKHKYSTIKGVLHEVATLRNKCTRLPEILGSSSQDISRNFRRLIARCNSLAIIFLQYKLHSGVLKLLKIAAATDLSLYKYGSLLDRLWQGRLVTYNNLAFFFQQ